MADIKSSAMRSENMRRIRRRNTKAELSLRRAIFKRGGRYRVDDGTVTGRPDLCFRGARVAVFVDSKFWHGQLKAERLALMAPYWQDKLRRNRRRDVAVNRALARRGWLVIRVPEELAIRCAEDMASGIMKRVHATHTSGRIIKLGGRDRIERLP